MMASRSLCLSQEISLSRLTDATGRYGELSYDYDAVGNIVQDVAEAANKALMYSASNRLEKVEAADGHVEYVYNAKGQRVIKRVLEGGNIEENHFHYNVNDQLIAETHADGRASKDYLYLGAERLAVVDHNLAEGGELLYVHNDHLGAPQIMTDADQVVVWQVDRKPFGEVDRRVASLDMQAGFPGQYMDGVTGYAYNHFRDYDPSIGRYLQSDPIGLQGGTNTFAYVSGNPLSWFDFFGFERVGRPYRTPENSAFANVTRQQAAGTMSVVGDALTVATPFTGPAAPYVGGAATVFTVGSMILDPSNNFSQGALSVTTTAMAEFFTRKVQGPLDMGEAAVKAVSAAADGPRALASTASTVAESSSGAGAGPAGTCCAGGG